MSQIPSQPQRQFELSFIISENILQILHEKKITKVKFAEMLGKRPYYIRYLTGGAYNFNLKMIAKIENVLGEKIFIK